jgi:TolA-binding protein
MRLLPSWSLGIRVLALAGVLLTAQLLTTERAAAQMTREEIELRNQMYELQQQVQTLQQQGQGGSNLGRQSYQPPQGGGSDIVAQLLARVQALEEEVRTLRGRIDEVQNAQQQQSQDLGKRIDDMRFQMQNPQAAGGPTELAPPAGPQSQAGPGAPMPLQPGPALSPPPAPLGSTGALPGQPPAPPVRRTPELAMQDGNLALARHDYPAAEAAAHEVLNNYRTSPRAYEAQFLLAQALFGERQFSQAAIAYDDTYNRNRKGVRAPEALVGLANALTSINEKRAACDTLGKLHAEFPQARPDIRDAAASAQQRAGCR